MKMTLIWWELQIWKFEQTWRYVCSNWRREWCCG